MEFKLRPVCTEEPPKETIVAFPEHVHGKKTCLGGKGSATRQSYTFDPNSGKALTAKYRGTCPGTCGGITRQVTVTF